MSFTNLAKFFETTFEVAKLPGFQLALKPVRQFDKNQEYEREFKFDVKLDSENIKISQEDNKNDGNMLLLILKHVISSFPDNHSARILTIKIGRTIDYLSKQKSRQFFSVNGRIDPELCNKILGWLPHFEDFQTQFFVDAIIENATARENQQDFRLISFRKLYPPCSFFYCHKHKNHNCVETEKEISEKLDPKINYIFTADLTIKLKVFKPNEEASFLRLKAQSFPHSLGNVASLNRRFLQEKMYTDMYIKTDSGACIPCHKLFLTATSPVIAKIFQDRLVRKPEENNCELKIDDASDDTIQAFLDFVYCADMEKAIKSASIAVELFILANKYNLGLLEERLLQLIFLKSQEFFTEDIESLLKCYLFLEMSGLCKVVEVRLGKIIKGKADEILQSQEYQDLLEESSEAATKIMECCRNN